MSVCVVVPGPPVLFPQLTGPGALAVEPVRQACDDALARLTGGGPSEIVVVGPGARTHRHPPGAWGTLAGFGVALEAPVAAADGSGRRGPAGLPLSLTVGCLLLDLTGWHGSLLVQEIAADAPPAECLALGARLARESAGAGWLVVADGTSKRTERAPGAFDPRAEPFDAEVTEALASGSASRLARLDVALAEELGASGRAAWQVLAGGCPAPAEARVTYTGAPLGVGYVVALWT